MPTVYHCNTCGLDSPNASEFVRRADRPSGVRSICIQCHRSVMRGYRAKHREERRRVLDELKSQPCADCGIQYPPYVMDFDHISEKDFTVSQSVWDLPLDVLVAEAAKCEVVCSNCHRARTHRKWQQGQFGGYVRETPTAVMRQSSC